MDDLFQKLRENIAEAEQKYEDKLKELAELNVSIEDAKDAQEKQLTELNTLEKATKNARNKYESELKALDKEKRFLKQDIDVLIAKKMELQTLNNNLIAKNTAFASYETKARNMLKTMETSLLQREKVIAERESLRPKASLLPSED